MKDKRWVETPKFILRGSCIRTVTQGWPPGRFLEVGAGTGQMTKLFLDLGFQGVCHEPGLENRDVLRGNLASHRVGVRVVEDFNTISQGSFQYLFAFEVLEHIDNDLDELRQWAAFLRPEGKVLVSVPAHQRKFDADDEAVGHYRRYEKVSLGKLLRNAGFANIQIANYGFPLANLTRHIRRMSSSIASRAHLEDNTLRDRSLRSGIECSRGSLLGARVANRHTLAPFALVQKLFYRFDLSDGYVAWAEKPTG